MVQVENNVFATELEQLKALGFVKVGQNLSLLKRTNGNVEVVAKFLEAKKAFREATESDRLQKKALKRELKQLKKRGHDDETEDIKVEKDALKKEKKKLKKTIERAEDDDKAQKKELKKAEKMAKKLAKQEARELKRGSKQKERKNKGNDDEKAKLKEQKRAEKKLAKEAEKNQLKAFVLPENITSVFLDGNNMLFVVNALRSKVLRRNMKEAEQMLESMTKAWVDANPQLKSVTLIFDDSRVAKYSERFNVVSARPHFPSSDHALIYWAQNASAAEKPSIAVFTSDRALKSQLESAGVQVFKSKVWFYAASNSLRCVEDEEKTNVDDTNNNNNNGKNNDEIDDWATVWLAKNFEKMNV